MESLSQILKAYFRIQRVLWYLYQFEVIDLSWPRIGRWAWMIGHRIGWWFPRIGHRPGWWLPRIGEGPQGTRTWKGKSTKTNILKYISSTPSVFCTFWHTSRVTTIKKANKVSLSLSLLHSGIHCLFGSVHKPASPKTWSATWPWVSMKFTTEKSLETGKSNKLVVWVYKIEVENLSWAWKLRYQVPHCWQSYQRLSWHGSTAIGVSGRQPCCWIHRVYSSNGPHLPPSTPFWLANCLASLCCPRARVRKPSLWSKLACYLFTNKVLLEYSHPRSLPHYLWPLACHNDSARQPQQRPYGPKGQKYLTYFAEEACQTLS